jgi:Protein of unknown function (DUF3431)
MPVLHDFHSSTTTRAFRRRLFLVAVAVITLLFWSHNFLYESSPNSDEHPLSTPEHDNAPDQLRSPSATYQPGTPNPPGQSYTRTLVVARTANESVLWLTNDYDLNHDPSLTLAIYTVDNPQSMPSVPMNKGHEVMPYLTHIITNYDNLTDITIFIHGHRWTWHNNDLLNSDAKLMVQSLSSEKVIRDGYMNLRCHLDPGCPDHIHPSNPSGEEMDTLNRPEEAIVGKAWLELFPAEKKEGPPKVLSQPCCGQFVLSRERIRMLPLERYVFFREWLFDTHLEDKLSGRVWEYVW